MAGAKENKDKSPENNQPSQQDILLADAEQKIILLEMNVSDLEIKKTLAEQKISDQENQILVLQSKKSDNESTISDLQKQVADRESLIEKLSDELRGHIQGSISITSDSGKGLPVLPESPVIINEVAYVFQKPAFVLGGVVYKSEEAAFDTELLANVIAIEGQTILRQQV